MSKQSKPPLAIAQGPTATLANDAIYPTSKVEEDIDISMCPYCKGQVIWPTTMGKLDIMPCPNCGRKLYYDGGAEGGPAKENITRDPDLDYQQIEYDTCPNCSRKIIWKIAIDGKSKSCPKCTYIQGQEAFIPGIEHLIDKHPVKTFASGAVRMDENTAAYSYIPPIALKRLGYIYKEGEQRYPGFNWRKGIPVSNIIDHALEHLMNWLSGDRKEDHLAKVMWAMATLIYYENEGILEDDVKWDTLSTNWFKQPRK